MHYDLIMERAPNHGGDWINIALVVLDISGKKVL